MYTVALICIFTMRATFVIIFVLEWLAVDFVSLTNYNELFTFFIPSISFFLNMPFKAYLKSMTRMWSEALLVLSHFDFRVLCTY